MALPRTRLAGTRAHNYRELSVEVMDVAQGALLLAGWVVAFMLGKELQTGFAQWQQVRRER